MSIVVTSPGFKGAVACHVAMGEWVVRGVTHLSLFIINYLTAMATTRGWLTHSLRTIARLTLCRLSLPPAFHAACAHGWLAALDCTVLGDMFSKMRKGAA